MNIVVSTELVEQLPPLPEGTLGLGPDGWQEGLFTEINIQFQGGTLRNVLDQVCAQYGSILGGGNLTLFHVARLQPNVITGWLVFQPEDPDRCTTTA